MSTAGLGWTAVGGGWLAAAGAPGAGRLQGWQQDGATDVLTLQRADEHAPKLPETCAEVGLGWHHLPLSGRRLEQPADQAALARLPAVLAALPGRRMVVHCSAGLHRTGLVLYLLARLAGDSPEAAVAAVAQSRLLTAEELCRSTRRHGRLQDLAEAWLAQRAAG